MQILSVGSSLLGIAGGVMTVLGTLPVVGSLNMGNLTFGSSASKLLIDAPSTSAISTISAGLVVLNNVTVDFNSSQPLNAGTYILIYGTSMLGTATQGTLPPSRSWSSLSVLGNNLVAILA